MSLQPPPNTGASSNALRPALIALPKVPSASSLQGLLSGSRTPTTPHTLGNIDERSEFLGNDGDDRRYGSTDDSDRGSCGS